MQSRLNQASVSTKIAYSDETRFSVCLLLIAMSLAPIVLTSVLFTFVVCAFAQEVEDNAHTELILLGIGAFCAATFVLVYWFFVGRPQDKKRPISYREVLFRRSCFDSFVG